MYVNSCMSCVMSCTVVLRSTVSCQLRVHTYATSTSTLRCAALLCSTLLYSALLRTTLLYSTPHHSTSCHVSPSGRSLYTLYFILYALDCTSCHVSPSSWVASGPGRMPLLKKTIETYAPQQSSGTARTGSAISLLA